MPPPPSSFATITTTNAPLHLGSESKGSYDPIERGLRTSGRSEKGDVESEREDGDDEDEEAAFRGRELHSAGFSIENPGSSKQ